MNQQPLVSIAMCTYNGEKYLESQIESIINQSYHNLEILIQDDGSTDQTLKILDSYARKDFRISVYRNKKNLGINKNFNNLIQRCSGQYVAISDQDDIWNLDKIQILVGEIGDHSLIYTDSQLIDASGLDIGCTLLEKLKLEPKSGNKLTDLFRANTISGHACLYRKDLAMPLKELAEHEKFKRVVYDQLIGTLASFSQGVKYIAPPLTYHRIHDLNNCNKFEAPVPRPIFKGQSLAQRKQSRIRRKVKKAWRQISRLQDVYDTFESESLDPFKLSNYNKKSFQASFFNFKLYRALCQRGIPNQEARKLSYGKYFYLIFGIF